MTKEEIIDEFHSDEWWKDDNKETYESLAEQLLDKGLEPQFVYEILSDAYCAAASEFGG